MAAWAARRFWTTVGVVEEDGGFGIRLDARALKTPVKTPLILPTRAMAEAIAAEWAAQDGVVQPLSMPVTRAANAALDKVAPQFDEVAALIAAYGETDLLCYRAASPEALAARQAAVWDPHLDWAARALDAPLAVTRGVAWIAQREPSLARLRAEVTGLDAFRLTALSDMVAISGSLILALAVLHGAISPVAAWDASRIDEAWQAEVWGRDDEAEAAEAVRRADFLAAVRFLAFCASA